MRKKFGIILQLGLFILFCVTLSWTAINSSAEVIDPYGNGQEFALSAQYADGKLILETTGGGEGEYQYQYWIKKKVDTDSGDSSLKQQYIWQLVGEGFSPANTAEVVIVYTEGETEYNLTDIYLDESGKFNVIVKIKDGSEVVDELYSAYAPEDVGKPIITLVEIDGRPVFDDYVVVKKSALDVKITSNIAEGTFELLYGEQVIASGSDGIFNDLSLNLPRGCIP